MSGQFRPVSKPRKWWGAALLSVLLSAVVGYLYVGRPKRAAFAALLTSLLLLLAFGFGGLMSKPTSGIIVFFSGIAFQIGFLVDVILITVRSRNYVIQRYNRWWVYVGAWIGMMIAVQTLLYSVTTEHSIRLAHTFFIPSGSMVPTILPGDYIIADAREVATASLQRGDVVIYVLPSGISIRIARLIGLPGEKIRMLDGILYINRQPVPREPVGEYSGLDRDGSPVRGLQYLETLPNEVSHITVDVVENSAGDTTNEFNVPEGHYFVMGDNRDESSDSRFDAGYVPEDNIAGVVAWIFWSSDLRRIGMEVQ